MRLSRDLDRSSPYVREIGLQSAKVAGVWPVSRGRRLSTHEANYTTLLMSTGLTFGSISALFGLTNGHIDQAQYAVLVTTVILSAVVPTLIATTFFEPRVREAI